MRLTTGQGGVATWSTPRLPVFEMAVLGVTFAAIMIRLVILTPIEPLHAVDAPLLLLPLVVWRPTRLDLTLDPIFTVRGRRLRWDGETVSSLVLDGALLKKEQVPAWRPGHDTVSLEAGELVFRSEAGELRAPSPRHVLARRRLLEALQHRVRAPLGQPVRALRGAPPWVGAVDHQTLTLPGTHGPPRGAPPERHLRPMAVAGAVGLATQALTLLVGALTQSPATLWIAAFLAPLTMAVAAAASSTRPRLPTPAGPLTLRVSASHLVVVPADGDPARWLWDDIDGIDGHGESMAIRSRGQVTLVDLADAPNGLVDDLLHDLRQRWARSRSSDEERARVEQNARVLSAAQRT